MTDGMKRAVETALLPCPFCGSPASIEESPQGSSVNPSAVEFSVGCDSTDEASCMGYQSLTTFPRRSEAIAAWNKRAALPLVGVEREEKLEVAVRHVRGIIVDAAMTGFNCHDGDWAERLFASQAVTHAALALLTGQPQEGLRERALKIIADEERFAATDDKSNIQLFALRVARVGTAKQILGELPLAEPVIAGAIATTLTTAPASPQRAEEIIEHEFGSIEVDARGSCKWTDVANAMTHIKAQLQPLPAPPLLAEQGEPK